MHHSSTNSNTTPLYKRIEDDLRAQIATGQLRPGDRLPTIQQLRVQWGGVNHLTVRRALSALISEGLLRSEQGRGSFVQARAPLVRRVALIVPNLEDALFSSIARGVQRVLAESGVKAVILDSRGTDEEQADNFAHLESMGLEAAILFPVIESDIAERICSLKERNFPMVLVDRTLEGIRVPSVVADNFDGGLKIARHLLECGHTRIAWLGETTSSAASARFSGLRDGWNDVGLVLPRSMVRPVRFHDVINPATQRAQLTRGVREIIGELWALKERPTALACVNDQTALVALEALARIGVRVPTECAVTGFDDGPEAARSLPPLSTVRQPTEKMGEEAARLLIERLNAPNAPIQNVILPVEFVRRAST